VDNKTVFEKYYREFLPKIYRFVYFRVGAKKEEAEELTSEIFLKALDAFDGFEEGKPFAPWIYQIAKNHLINHYRVAGRTVPMDEDFDAPDLSAAAHVQKTAAKEDVLRFLSVLPPQKRRESMLQKDESRNPLMIFFGHLCAFSV